MRLSSAALCSLVAPLLLILLPAGHMALAGAPPVILQAGMGDATHFTALVSGGRSGSPVTLRLEERTLVSSHPVPAASGAVLYRFDLKAAGVPRFRGPAGYVVCTAHICLSGRILLPVAVVHGVLGDLAGLSNDDPYPDLLSALRRAGYSDTGPYPTLSYITYPSAAGLLSLVLPNNVVVSAVFGDGVAAFASRYLAPGVTALLANSYAARVDIVGHSMGGLIARAYLGEPGAAAEARTVVLLGTPNQGSAATFESVGPRTDLPETGRDLLPTYPYLRDAASGRFLPPPLSNTYLLALNRVRRPAGVRFVCVYGRAVATDNVLVVRGSAFQITGTVTAPGDGTVTAASAVLAGAQALPLDDGVRHRDLPRDPRAQSLIVGLLRG